MQLFDSILDYLVNETKCVLYNFPRNISLCFSLNPMLPQVFHGVVHHLVKEMMSPYPVVRKQARQALTVLSEITRKTVKEILEPLPKDLISETVFYFL